MPRQLDLAAACEAFVAVAERESFTAGAVSAGLTQSVASRRVAALEEHLGGRLFERSSRSVALTDFGRQVLPSASKLVTAVQELADDAGRARLLPVTVAVPSLLPAPILARIGAAADAAAMPVELIDGGPRDRDALFGSGRAQLALDHVEPDRARWSSPLGVASAVHGAAHRERAFFLAELRPRRGGSERRRLWLQPEDDVPHVRDRIERARNGAGLAPGHLRIASSRIDAMAHAMTGVDLVLCTEAEAAEFDLAWHPLGELHLVRGYLLRSRDPELARRFADACRHELTALLGARRQRVSDAR